MRSRVHAASQLAVKRGIFAPLESRPENVLIRLGFTAKDEVTRAIASGNFICDERRCWIRRSPDESYRQVRGCGAHLYQTIARWAEAEPMNRAVYRRRNLRRAGTPEQLLSRIHALRRAATFLRGEENRSATEREEAEIVADALVYQADLLEAYLTRNFPSG